MLAFATTFSSKEYERIWIEYLMIERLESKTLFRIIIKNNRKSNFRQFYCLVIGYNFQTKTHSIVSYFFLSKLSISMCCLWWVTLGSFFDISERKKSTMIEVYNNTNNHHVSQQ